MSFPAWAKIPVSGPRNPTLIGSAADAALLTSRTAATVRTPARPREMNLVMSSSSQLSHVAGVTPRVSPGLRPHGEAVGLLAHLDDRHRSVGRVDRVDDVVVAPRKPEHLPVGADVP